MVEADGDTKEQLTAQIDLIDSNIIINDDFKKNVAIPYFKDIYKDLVAQSDNKSKGINKITVLNVSIHGSKCTLSRVVRINFSVALNILISATQY